MSGHANDAEKNVANVAHGGKGLVAKLSPRLGEHVIRGTLLFLVPVHCVSNSYSPNRFHQSEGLNHYNHSLSPLLKLSRPGHK